MEKTVRSFVFVVGLFGFGLVWFGFCLFVEFVGWLVGWLVCLFVCLFMVCM